MTTAGDGIASVVEEGVGGSELGSCGATSPTAELRRRSGGSGQDVCESPSVPSLPSSLVVEKRDRTLASTFAL